MIDKDLFKLLGNNKKYIFYVVILMILSMLANTAITASICLTIYYVIQKVDAIFYLYPVLIFLFSAIIRYLTSRGTNHIKDLLGRKVKKDLRERAYRKCLSLGVKCSDDISLAGLTQISIEGVEQLDLYYSTYLPQFFFSIVSPIILFIITVFIDYKVALVLLACVPLIPISIVAVSKYAKKIFAKYWGVYISMGDKFLDSIQGLTELKVYEADQRQNELIDEHAENFRKITMKVLVMQLASTTIMDIVAYGGAGIGIALTIMDLSNLTLSPSLALFLILVAVEFFLPLRALGSAFHVAMNGASAGKKILNLLNIPDPIWGKEEIKNTTLELKNVTFSYDDRRSVLNDINIFIPSTGITAIVGESGSGKSTIVSLLIGSFHPQIGQVLIGGKDITCCSRESYYSHLALISHNTYIFNETVLDNFKLAKQNITDEEIISALNKVNLKDFIINNFGLNKKIAENGSNMSGGQKQRLALAINLVADKDIYIFDEATSNIDIESEKIIMKNIEELAKTKCVILISHRLENVIKANNIYYLKDGKVQEEGSHQMLMNKEGYYYSLYTAQKELETGYLKIVEA